MYQFSSSIRHQTFRNRNFTFSVFLACSLGLSCATTGHAQENLRSGAETRNSSGTKEIESNASGSGFPEIEVINQEIAGFMTLVNATAATVAISYRGEIIYSKGFGFSDRRKRIVTLPRTTMRIASCTKPFTAAAIRKLIDQGELSLDTQIFDYLGIRPVDSLADPRVKEITIGHLLEHRGGWDRDQTFDPLYQIPEIKTDMRVRKVEKRHIVRYMWKHPLQSAPGEKRHYSNFGYLLLGLVIEKSTGKSYINSIRDLVAESIGAEQISTSSPVKSNRRSREVHYPIDNKMDYRIRDSASGIATNSESLCKFMSEYWLDGTPLDRRRRYLYQFGTHPFTTSTLMEQRLDGIHYAIMLNSRRNDFYDVDNNAMRDQFNQMLDSVKSQLIDK